MFGCLYFHVSDQLQHFVDRLARFDVSFKVFNRDTLDFSRALSRNTLSPFGLTSTSRFDRIDVSNVIDVEYVGTAPVVDAWGRFLKRTQNAALLGYYMNWPGQQPGATPNDKHGNAKELVDTLIQSGRVSSFPCTPPRTWTDGCIASFLCRPRKRHTHHPRSTARLPRDPDGALNSLSLISRINGRVLRSN